MNDFKCLLVKVLMQRWEIHTYNNIESIFEMVGVNKFDVFLEVNFSTIFEVLKETQATDYYYYKMCFEMVNMDLKYEDEHLEFIFNEINNIKEFFK